APLWWAAVRAPGEPTASTTAGGPGLHRWRLSAAVRRPDPTSRGLLTRLFPAEANDSCHCRASAAACGVLPSLGFVVVLLGQPDEAQHVIVIQRVVDVLAFAAVLHDAH